MPTGRLGNWALIRRGIWDENPVFRQLLGICSALAVTNLLANTLVMGLGLIFVTGFSCLTVSLLRTYTPFRIRMMVQVLIIAVYVIVVDLTLKAYLPDISEQLGAYVGLIITNCIIMGRAEGYARSNPPWPSFIDGLAMGIGYTLVLASIAFVRELMGTGTLLGFQVLGEWWTPWIIMVMPPAGFFGLATVIWVVRGLFPEKEEKK
ncbi:NADH:ubiquinone reductase (Na(+)-transporting) subunit D [Planctomycetota bacterium]